MPVSFKFRLYSSSPRQFPNEIPLNFTNKITFMKKFLLLGIICSAIISTTANAQTGGGPAATQQQTKEDQAAMLQQVKDKIKPQMVEKTGLTDAQADKVIELNFEMRQAAGALDPNDADRPAKIAE
jgi:hypothetical protein